jgi:hypothetical protein
MKKKSLAQHKLEPKQLTSSPVFSPIKRGKLPKPLHQIGGPRVQATQLITVGEKYSVWFMWRNGETLEQRAFYAFLFYHVGESGLYPLCHFHWHPSHKPIHIKTPCGSDLNYTNRGLPGAHEMHLKPFGKRFDPRFDQDRLKLIEVFCKACGIKVGTGYLI